MTDSLAPCRAAIDAAFVLLRDAVAAGGKILTCGNGGSAADAEHIVGELMKGFHLKRPLTAEEVAALAAVSPQEGPRIAAGLQRPIAAISLVSQTALITAIANDNDADLIFAQQVLGLGRPGDVLVALSTSGNSRNVIAAAQVARAFGLKVVALTGAGGGALAPLADVAIRVPATQVPAIQELHLPVYHELCARLEQACFG
ncbi:D-sedoheptulose-7-phosphate isomerase [Phaeospirillum tilakii]|uniref:SIS domain-containing protein n=1 Tax=Phaeospirillum tilakii TaxID=741673 RepID=A0ABW5CDN6_9PROT